MYSPVKKAPACGPERPSGSGSGATLVCADLLPGALTGLLHLLGVLDPELAGGLQGAPLALGIQRCAS
jgi:hypothetical protein